MNVRRSAVLLLLCFAFFAQVASAASPNVVISQVYGGAGCGTAGCSTYKNDYIELFNRGTSAVSLNGWSVQYGAATGTSWQVSLLPNFTLQPGQYFLVGESSGPNGTNAIPTPDFAGTIAMAAGAGKVALSSATAAFSGACPTGASLVDFVGYGTTANCSETTPAPVPSTANADIRSGSGCQDTDNNSADFAAAPAAPRNSASATHPCGVVTNNPPSINAPANPIATVTQDAAPFTVALSGADDGNVFNWSATSGAGVQSVSVSSGQGTANVQYMVTLIAGFNGTASFTASLSDNVNVPPVTQTVNIQVNPPAVNNPPAIFAPADPIITVTRDAAPFTVNLTGSDDHGIYNWSAAAGTGVSSVTVTGASTATFTVTLNGGFTGTATFTASLSDSVNAPATQNVNILVNPPALPAGTIVISQIYGGGGNVGSTLQNDFIELFNRSNSPVSVDGWSVQHFSSSNPSWFATPLSGVIQPHSYYLVQEAAGTTPGGGTVPLPTPDAIGTIGLSSTAGTVAVTKSTTLLSGDICATNSDIVDWVGYGTGSSCSGRVGIGGLSNTIAASRRLGGCTYTPSATDFSLKSPAPRNSASPVNDCTGTETFTPHVMISQLYGGGGNSGATFTNDFVELYNPTDADVLLEGWSIQYTSSTGNTWASNSQPLGGSIPTHGYFLIELASGGATGAALPPPRIISDINMSQTSGKLALVKNFTPLTGNCPLGDPMLVDFIGYGTPDCFEGGLPAPGLSSSKADIRATNSDTDQNSADFTAVTPTTPRGSGALVPLPPLVSSTEPATTNAPFDSTVTINFSEAVTVADGWFSISCLSSGPHTDVQITSAFGDGSVPQSGRTWAITPNVTFTPGEQCTVRIFKSGVTKAPQSGDPNLDNLPNDFTFTFTVASAVVLPYPPDVHLMFGNPSAAAADTRFPNNYLMSKPQYALSYNRDLGRPNWVSWHLTNEWFGSITRVDTFRADPAVPSDWYRVQAFDFASSGFDRGHMCPNADRDSTVPTMQSTFLMSNMVAQAPNNNQGPWADLEGYLRTVASTGNELYIVSGPAGIGGTGSNGGTTMTLANGHVTVPAFTWKAVIVLPKLDGNDVARVTAATPTVAVIMPNVNGLNSDWHTYLTSVDAIEQMTGYDLFSNIPAAIQNAIEAGVNGDNPPGAADESVNTPEDTAKTITLDVASPNSNPLTYTIVTQPLHGTLAGSDVTQTYTPAPDFNGTDSFTYRVSDGTHTSNTARVTITILEANDPPVATDDSKSTDEDTLLNFAWSDLTGNDTAGPANESTQTLTVTSVSPAADTHGTLTLSGAQITYAPEANYNGPASFTYTVCDNGITAGQTDSRCATATVHLTVATVNDAPTAVDDSKTTDEDTPFTFAASDLMSNDSAGPANENDQTLAVTSVNATADTHGTVTLNAGQISYAPDANYNGPASFSYRVCDNGSSRGVLDAQCATATVHVTINPVNDPPSASITVASTSAEGTAVTASVNVTDPDAGDTFTYAWSVTKNGAPYASATSTSFTFTPNDNGSYVVSVSVTDHAGATGTDSKTVAVTNVAPSVAISGAPASVAEGTPIALSAGVSDPGTADTFTYSWIVTRNGSPFATGNTPLLSFTPADNGSYVVVLTVTDDDGGAGSASASIAVNNVTPVITSLSLSSAAIDENGTVTLTGAFTDPGDDTHTRSINWGDGSAVTPVTLTHGSRTFSASHQYLDDTPSGTPSDVLSISVTVADNDGGTANSTTPITVKNVAPVITSVSGPTAPLTIGGTAAINVHYTDVGSRDTHTALFSWDDGSTSNATCAAGLCSASHIFAATGVYGVAITLSDDDGGVAAAKFTFVIVTDPNGGSVKGNGSIISPPGAFVPDARVVGKLSFDIDAKYDKKGLSPSSHVQLEFNHPDLKFKSTSINWLVVAGANAQLAGTGSVNGTGSYGFIVTVVDGDLKPSKTAGPPSAKHDDQDKFRIRVWDKSSGATVYDNVAGASDDIDNANPQLIDDGKIDIKDK